MQPTSMIIGVGDRDTEGQRIEQKTIKVQKIVVTGHGKEERRQVRGEKRQVTEDRRQVRGDRKVRKEKRQVRMEKNRSWRRGQDTKEKRQVNERRDSSP